MSDYWDGVRTLWTRFEAAAVGGTSVQPNEDAIVKPMLPFSLYRTTFPIAVTGLRGSGKSILYESLIGKVVNSYVPHGKSTDAEMHKTFIRLGRSKIRAVATVLPGQDSEERTRALDAIFGGGNYPTGVIHTASYGFGTVWDAGDQQSISEKIKEDGGQVDLEAIHRWNLREEVADFEATCNLLKGAWGRRSGVWIIIAVTKCDLYWPERSKVRDYYIPGRPTQQNPDELPTESAFCKLLRGVVEYIGEGNCKVAVVPLSCYAEEYKFDVVLKQTSLDSKTIASLVNHFRSLVGGFCES